MNEVKKMGKRFNEVKVFDARVMSNTSVYFLIRFISPDGRKLQDEFSFCGLPFFVRERIL